LQPQLALVKCCPESERERERERKRAAKTSKVFYPTSDIRYILYYGENTDKEGNYRELLS